MERLTKHSKILDAVNAVVPSDSLGDLCMKMDFCDEFEFCIGCPVKKLMDRLCEYEDTGFTPEQIEEMKKSANNKKCQRTTEYPELKELKNCSHLLPSCGTTPEDVREALERVKNLKHKDKKESIHRVMRYGLLINGKKYFVPDLVFEHFGEKVKVIVENNIATVYDIETDEQIVWFELDEEIDDEYISRTNYFEEAMYYLLEHHALTFENGKLYFLQQNLPETQLFPRNCKTKMIQRIINFCEKI